MERNHLNDLVEILYRLRKRESGMGGRDELLGQPSNLPIMPRTEHTLASALGTKCFVERRNPVPI